MRVFAISDLHLPGGDTKPMEVFGAHWDDHMRRIASDWSARVAPEDLVLLPGDLSWAMKLSDALPDLALVDSLPGQKLILRGNHDYWWGAIGTLREVLSPNMRALQNDAVDAGDVVIAGSRGWLTPGTEPLGAEDDKIYRREQIRLRLSLDHARRLAGGDRPIIGMTHFPPVGDGGRASGFTELFESYGVELAVYGHLHGPGIKSGFWGEARGVNYRLVSCDALGFQLMQVWPPENRVIV